MDHQMNTVNCGIWTPRSKTLPAQLNLNQSLPGNFFGSESSFNSTNNFGDTQWSPREWNQNYCPNLFDNSPVSPYMPSLNLMELNLVNYSPSVFSNSPVSPFMLNQNVVDAGPKIRSTSFSFDRTITPSNIDDTIFGTFEEGNGVRHRSKSFVETAEALNKTLPSSSLVSTNNLNTSRSSRRFSNRTNSVNSQDEECGYCRSIGVSFHGHNKKQCPQLVQLNPCSTCGASGEDNHTKKHCPYSGKEILQLKPEFEARITANIKKRQLQRKEQKERREYATVFRPNRRLNKTLF